MNTERCKGLSVNNMSIVEDLGMIHYIFSDKTGTLTRNQMEFHSMCVGEEVFAPNQLNNVFDRVKFENCITGKELAKPVSLMLSSSNLDEGMEIESI